MVSQNFNDHDHVDVRKNQKPEWEPTSADSEKNKEEDTYYITNSLEGAEQEGASENNNDFNNNSGAEGLVNNVLVLKLKKGQPPSQEQLGKLLQTALDQGWETLYVYGANKKTPDLQMAQYIQQFILQQNLQGRINCCLSPEVYRQYKGLEDLQEQNESKGATPKPNINI